MIDCLFCDPARSRILARSGGWYARFDNFPPTPCHVEIVPFEHVDSWFSLSPVEQLEAFSLLDEAADVVKSMRRVEAWNWGVNDGQAAGRTIAHLHIHLVRSLGDQDDPHAGIRRGLPNGDPDTSPIGADHLRPPIGANGTSGVEGDQRSPSADTWPQLSGPSPAPPTANPIDREGTDPASGLGPAGGRDGRTRRST